MVRILTALGLVCLVACTHDWDRLGEGGDGGSSSSTSTTSSSGFTATTFCTYACEQRDTNCSATDGTCGSTCPSYVEGCVFPDDSANLVDCVEANYGPTCSQAFLADGAFSTCTAMYCEPQ